MARLVIHKQEAQGDDEDDKMRFDMNLMQEALLQSQEELTGHLEKLKDRISPKGAERDSGISHQQKTK